MKNKFYNILLLFIFLLNAINIFSEENIIKEVPLIESIHSNDEEISSLNETKRENIISENASDENIFESPNKDYNAEELKATNVINTNKDLKDNTKEQDNTDDKFEEISDRTNRVTALGSAMGAIDLSKTPEKKIRVGAGVGHSANNQAVAVGVGYAPTERLKLNTKFSTSTNKPSSNSISIGASYDLDW